MRLRKKLGRIVGDNYHSYMMSASSEIIEDSVDAILAAVAEYVKEKLPEWPEPQPGAGEGLGPLAGVGMYAQYDDDRKKRKKEIDDLLAGLEEKP